MAVAEFDQLSGETRDVLGGLNTLLDMVTATGRAPARANGEYRPEHHNHGSPDTGHGR